MLLTEFFNSPEGDSSAKSKTASPTTEAKRTQITSHNMVAEGNEMADIITARDYVNKALRDPASRQSYFDYLASLRAKHGKEYSTSIHQKVTKMARAVDEDQWSNPGGEGNSWHDGKDQWSDGRGQWSESTDGVDTITVDVPLMIRLLEYAREDAESDMDLHNVAEQLTKLSQDGCTLSMQDYDTIVSSTN